MALHLLMISREVREQLHPQFKGGFGNLLQLLLVMIIILVLLEMNLDKETGGVYIGIIHMYLFELRKYGLINKHL